MVCLILYLYYVTIDLDFTVLGYNIQRLIDIQNIIYKNSQGYIIDHTIILVQFKYLLAIFSKKEKSKW